MIFSTVLISLYHTNDRLLHSFPTRRSSDLGLRPVGPYLPKLALHVTQQIGDRLRDFGARRRRELVQNGRCLPARIQGVTHRLLGQAQNLRRPTLFDRSEEHTSELQSRGHLVCRLLLEKKKKII